MSKTVEPKNFKEWLESADGKQCMQPADFRTGRSLDFLEKRLFLAYTSGMGVVLSDQIYTTPSPDVAGSDAVAVLRKINHICGTVNFSSHNQMREAIEEAVSLTDEALQSEHPQPAGASVEDQTAQGASHDYAKDLLGSYDPELQEEYDKIREHFLAGAAFQAAHGVGLDETLGLANKTIEAIYQLLAYDIPDDKILEKVELEIDRYHEYQLSHPLIESAPYPAPGIPDVRELVEGLEDVAKCMHLCPKCKRTVQNTITALEGFKRK